MEIKGTSAVVTGGGNGIGKAIAVALAQNGVNVAIADIELDAAKLVADEVESHAVKALAVQVDVTDEAAVKRLADEAWKAFGSVELLFNNAGVIPDQKPLWQMTAEDVRWVLSVNLEGVLTGIRVFTPRFIESGKPAHIVNTGSEHSLGMPHTGAGIYTGSKHAVLGISDVLRNELPGHVGVSVLCPGLVASSLWRAKGRRPDALGGATEVDPSVGGFMEQFGMPASEVAARVLKGIAEDSFLIPTHSHVYDNAKARWDEIDAAFKSQAPRYEGDDKYDVAKLIERLMNPAEKA